MNQNVSTFYETWPDRMNAMKSRPGGTDAAKAFGALFQGIMRDSSADGGLSGKQKELIALAIGVASRCESCIYAHVEKCLKMGASSREVMDAASVAVMMGGGPMYTYLPVVSEALAHFEQPVETA